VAERRERSRRRVIGVGNLERKDGAPVAKSKEDPRRALAGEPVGSLGREQTELERRRGGFRAAQERLQTPQREDQLRRIATPRRDPRRVETLVARAIERAAGKRDHFISPGGCNIALSGCVLSTTRRRCV